MHVLRRPPTLLYLSRSPPARCFTTVPIKIPSHIKIWDPTLHAPNRPQEIQAASVRAVHSKDEELLRRSEREKLRNLQSAKICAEGDENAVRHFNELLLRSNHRWNREPKLWNYLWEAYTYGKGHVRGFLCRIPERAWDIMWATQNARAYESQGPLVELYRDMDLVSKTPTVGQRVKYLEDLYGSGKKEQALTEWGYDREHVDGSRHDYKPEHLEVGVKLHALAGDVERAQSIMEELFDLYPTWDPSIMMTVFRAHTSFRHDQHVAKDLYVKMKAVMGTNSTLEHYDSWFIGFLEARNIQYAKLVFKDMVKDGKIAHCCTPEHVNEVLKRFYLLYHLGTDISKMTSIVLYGITVLPKPFHIYLFGDLMKSSAIHHAPEAAAQTLDMMLHRGYKASTYEFNMLLLALFRKKERSHILKAENIGWRMIDEARKLSLPKPKACPETASQTIAKSANLVSDVDHANDKPNVPPADAETFAMMMQYHGERLQWEHVDYLLRQLKESEVRPNVSLMNIIVDNLCRQGKYRKAWKIYKSFTCAPEGTVGVFPNGASFRHLWKTLRIVLSDEATCHDPMFPSPRALLAETVRWWAMCRNRFDAERFLHGLSGASRRAISGLMMHCFSYKQDLPGSLVALHVLSKHFGIFPDKEAAEILQKQLAWINVDPESRSVHSQRHVAELNKQNIGKMRRTYNILLGRRLARMGLTGDEYLKMDDEETKEIRLNLLSEFVRVALKRQSSPKEVEAMIDVAKKAVGVEDMSTGDLDAFAVA